MLLIWLLADLELGTVLIPRPRKESVSYHARQSSKLIHSQIINNMQHYINIPLYYIITTYGNYIGYRIGNQSFTCIDGTIHTVPKGESIISKDKIGNNIHLTN